MSVLRSYRVTRAPQTTRICPNANRLQYAARTKIPAEAGIFKKCGDHLLSPRDYHRPYRLNYRVRNGNGCLPARIVTATAILAAASTESSLERAKCRRHTSPLQNRIRGHLRGRCGVTHTINLPSLFFKKWQRSKWSSRDSETCSCSYTLTARAPADLRTNCMGRRLSQQRACDTLSP